VNWWLLLNQPGIPHVTVDTTVDGAVLAAMRRSNLSASRVKSLGYAEASLEAFPKREFSNS